MASSESRSNSEKQCQSVEFKHELLTLMRLAIPLIVACSSRYFSLVLTTMFAGHFLSTVEFDAVALGLTMTNITGYSMIIAFVSPMDSLSTQANGAKNWKLYSITLHRAIICSSLMCIPIVILWCFMYRVLLVCGQNHAISHYVYQWTLIYISILPAYVAITVLTRFLSSQGIGKPLLYLGVLVYFIWHPLWLYLVFIHFEKRSFVWAPVVNVVTVYIHVTSIIVYIAILRPHHPLSLQRVQLRKVLRWKTKWKQDTFIKRNMDDKRTNIHVIDKGMSEYVSLMIAGIFSICAEWWSWEIVTLLCGLLGPIQLAVHVVFATIIPLYYMIILGLGLAGASRVGALIGENRFHLARKLGNAILWMTLCESLIIAALSFVFRDYVSLLFTSDGDVVHIASKLSPLFALFVIWDAFQGAFQGILRGIKRQAKSVIGVLVGPWLITLPLSCLLAFSPTINLKIFGMWIGNNVGYLVMNAIFFYLWLTFEWDEQQSHINELEASSRELQEKKKTHIVRDDHEVVTSLRLSHFSAFAGLRRL